jgi:acyl-CoA thioester hydrolase
MHPTHQHPLDIRWSDLDPNVHVRHSRYYDWGAQMRMKMLFDAGITMKLMKRHSVGVILMEENCRFRREVKWGDQPYMVSQWTTIPENPQLFEFEHQLFKGEGVFCAEIKVRGAWMNTEQRKLSAPPLAIQNLIDSALSE